MTSTTNPVENKVVQSIIALHKDKVGELKMIIRMIEGYPSSNNNEEKLLPYYKAALKIIETK